LAVSVTKVGTEFLVNTQTASYQFDPTVTSLQNGGFVVTWSNFRGTLGDNSQDSIKAKVFDAAGALVTDEFLVNTQTAYYQEVPTITGLQNGGFVVIWEDKSTLEGDGSGSRIKAKVFDAAGALVTDEFLVKTQMVTYAGNPTITGLQNGGFVVTWSDHSRDRSDRRDNEGTSIKAKVFDAAGALVTDEFLINTQTASYQLDPTVTSLQNGGFVVTWYDYSGTLGDSSETSIKAKVFDAAGTPVTNEFLVNTQTADYQWYPTVTGLQNGGFVVTWQDASGTLGDSSDDSIKAKVFDAAGALVTDEFLVNTQTASDQLDPTITGLQNGGFVVSWEDNSGTLGDSSRHSIKAKVFDAAGALVTDEFLVNTQTADFQLSPTITGLQNGGFVVSWEDNSGTLGDSSGSSIKAQIFSVNSPPVVTAHDYSLDQNGPLTVAAAQGLLSGASDPENDPLSALLVSNPAHGTLSLNNDGSFVYQAANTFFGEDSFSFKANDGALDSNISTVKIDVTREISSETTRNPNGGSTTTYYDAKGDKPWTSQSHNFDSNGHETSATVSYDDGSLQGATFDANDNQSWKSQSSVANALGQVTNMGVIYDDGTQQTGIFDAGNNQPWLSQHAVYDALGRMINLGVIYDDGSQQTAIFDAENNQLWSSQNMVYDVHGHLTNVGVIYDDLHTETAVYDVHADQPWISQSAVYDPSGKLIAASVRYDDGHVENWHI
jgi:hypothetical protein